MANTGKLFLALVYFVLQCKVLNAQRGNTFIQNFLPTTYQGAANNSGITQNDEGLIFVANNNGVMIYDGIQWEYCKRYDEISIFCISKTVDNEIVTGTADGDIARIVKDSRGKYQYQSLLDSLAEDLRPTEIIRQIIHLGSSTFFLSADRLVEYKDHQLKVYTPENSFHNRAFILGSHLYVLDVGNSIKFLKDGKLNPVPGSEDLSSEKPFYCFPINPTQSALGFRDLGTILAYYDTQHPEQVKFQFVNASCDAEIIGAEANNGLLLRNGNFIVTTNKNGAIELDKNLRVVNRYNSKKGIYDDNIKSAFQDINGNLWLSLFYGISFVEINSRVFHYSRENGISGAVEAACYYNSHLIIATDKGVQYYDSLSEKFQFLHALNKQAWALLPVDNKLFIGTAKGLFVYSNAKVEQINENNTRCLMHHPYQRGILYSGGDAGLEVFRMTRTSAQLLKTIETGSPVRNIAADHRKNVFFATMDQGIYYLNTGTGVLDSITEKEGLPHRYVENCVFTYSNNVYTGTDEGIYILKKNTKGRFVCEKDKLLWPVTRSSQVFSASEADKDLVFFQRTFLAQKGKNIEKITLLERKGDSLFFNNGAVNRLTDIGKSSITYDSSSNTVFICAEGLYLLRKSQIDQNKHYHFFLKRFIAGEDTLISNLSEGMEKEYSSIRIPYSENNLHAFLGFTSFESGTYEFSYRLEGGEDDYSEWSKEPSVVFGNLFEGKYVLHVRARTELENRIHEIILPFRISPPWYRSGIAYGVYTILIGVLILLIVQLNIRRLKAANKKLEKTVEERTKTISLQKSELEYKQKEIMDSIIYARRIQRALLASENFMRAHLREYFVYFQPKDVVSGDFYWASILKDGRFALASADSTGHGVPGAIMSMLNISCLKEAVEAQKLDSPKEILNHARKKVIETLANDGSEEGGKDGMDCSLACFDFKTGELTYAAANNPIWVLRKKEDQTMELFELEADKMPVGKHDHDRLSFREHQFKLQSGDMVYTLTDGFADQFGGPKGKKFMYKRLKELLTEICNLPSQEQFQKVKNAFESWKGPLEQVDDVSLIGIRI